MSLHDEWTLDELNLAAIRGEHPASERLLPPLLDSLAGIFDRVERFLHEFAVIGEHEAAAIILFIAHTHAFDAAEATPYLHITSAEKRSGKTRLLDFLDATCSNPWRAVTPSEAVTFRKIAADRPTLLLDEIDAVFGPGQMQHEGLRALLNAGYRKRGSTIPRCVGEGSRMRVQDFSTFCPKALAGIGRLPDTVADRSIRIEMRRKLQSDQVRRWRERDCPAAAEPLRDALNALLVGRLPRLADASPVLPDELNDRLQDAWEPLLAIADLAGHEIDDGRWPARARQAAVRLAASVNTDELPLGNQLLNDLRVAYDGEGVAAMTTGDLIALLCDLDGPWQEYRHGQPITARGISTLLAPYGVRPQKWREGSATVRGYARDDLVDAWERWLPASTEGAPPPTIATPATSATSAVDQTANGSDVADVADVADPVGAPDRTRALQHRLGVLADSAGYPDLFLTDAFVREGVPNWIRWVNQATDANLTAAIAALENRR